MLQKTTIQLPVYILLYYSTVIHVNINVSPTKKTIL